MQPSANHFKILYLHLVRKFNLVLWCLKLRFQTWENHSKSLFSLGRAKQDINFRISKAIISVLQSSKRFTERKRDYSSLSILYLVSISKIKRHEGNLTHTNMDHESHKYQYTQIISLPTILGMQLLGRSLTLFPSLAKSSLKPLQQPVNLYRFVLTITCPRDQLNVFLNFLVWVYMPYWPAHMIFNNIGHVAVG